MAKDLISSMCPYLVQVVTTLVGGMAICFYYEWRTASVALGVLPFILLSGMLQMKIAEGFGDQTDKVYEDGSNLIAQSISYIRTVAAFCS
jgi:ABC-type transport system involved in cytochrome bd biosynthesis fused ATPase/permease subunit